MAVTTQGPTHHRTPPHDIQAERCVLGCMLLNPDAVGTAIEILRENPKDVFHAEQHQHIYKAVIDLFRKPAPVDALTLMNQLKANDALEDAGDATYLADLTDAVPNSANVEYYANIVLDAAIRRNLIKICDKLSSKAFEDNEDVRNLLDTAEQDVFKIAEQRQTSPVYSLRELVTAGVERLEKLKTSRSGITGLATGYPDLDRMLMGMQPSNMVILGARPSVGKTAFALNVARNVAVRDHKPVLIFSLEMSKEEITQRMLCLEAELDMERLRDGFQADKEFQKLPAAADRLLKAPIFIDDTPNINVLDIRSKARRHFVEHEDTALVIVDYLQLMSAVTVKKNETRQNEISEISRAVKALARELGVPVLALSQLNRQVERDSDSGEPRMSHIRESGSIEQDADVILLLWRPGKDPDSHDVKLAVAKQRNGPTGIVDLQFIKPVQRFHSVAGRVHHQEDAPDEPYDAPDPSIDFGGNPDEDPVPF